MKTVDIKKIGTEQRNENTLNIDQGDSLEIVSLINAEDKTVPLAVEKALPQIAQVVDAIVERFLAGGRLIYMGAGTSGRIGILDAVECRPTFSAPDEMVQCLMAGGEAAFIKAKEGAEDSLEQGGEDLARIKATSKDLVVGITASGRTPYVIGGLQYAKSRGITTACITTSPASEVAALADLPIEAITGAEPVTGSTRMKSGTAQKLICNMLSTASMIKLGKVYSNLMIDVQPTNEKLVKRAENIIQTITGASPEQAAAALKTYGGVKVAIVGLAKGVDKETATQLLAASAGHLRKALEG